MESGRLFSLSLSDSYYIVYTMPTESIFDINKKLIQHYGKAVDADMPKLRVVWSTNQYEWRVNPAGFDIYSSEGLFLRTEFGPKEVEKYPMFPDHWVLEVLVPVVIPELPNVKYGYEPLWIFGAANSSREPVWKAIKLLIDAKLQHHRDMIAPRETKESLIAKEKAKDEKYKELIKDVLRNENTLGIKEGSAVVVPASISEVNSNG